MFLGDITAIALSVIGFLLSLQGLWLVCRALWPRRTMLAAERCRDNRIACFFLGLAVTLVLVMIAGVIGRRGGTPGRITAWIIGACFLMYAGVGMSGLVTFIGQRLASPVDAARPWRATIRGGVALQLAFLFPVIGWFVLMPVALILGAGATSLSFLGSGRSDLQATLRANRASATRPRDIAELPSLNSSEVGV